MDEMVGVVVTKAVDDERTASEAMISVNLVMVFVVGLCSTTI